MTPAPTAPIRLAIACGGTGGHLFPGLAVGERLVARGCEVVLLISSKEVDREAVKTVKGMETFALPAIGLTQGRGLQFLLASFRSYRQLKNHFKQKPPQAALAMGGFTSAPALLAARRLGARTFLHESNTIPGRANRLLSWLSDGVFVGFPSAANRLHGNAKVVTGTPVRARFHSAKPEACRAALALDPRRPVVLVMGGSQGASGINNLVAQALPLVAKAGLDWQWFHLAGAADAEKMTQAYAASKLTAVVQPFFSSMELAMGASSASISRAGASSLAELAAVGLPSVLVPYPAAVENHQLHNAQAFEQTGAARLLPERGATPEALVAHLKDLIGNESVRHSIRTALAGWAAPHAAEQIADTMLKAIGFEVRDAGPSFRDGPASSDSGGLLPRFQEMTSEEFRPGRAA